VKRLRERWIKLQKEREALSSWLLVAVMLCLAWVLCLIISKFSWIDNDAPVVFLMAVVVVSRFTTKYRYGITASLVSTFAINYFFTYPYNFFTLMIAGYPVDFVCMTTVSIMISTITTQEREEARRAVLHEQETIRLYDENRKLEEKRAEARIEAEKEKMYSNLLRAVSHDLRTPLTSIAGASAAMMETEVSLTDEERKSLASDVHSEALWLSQMVENLLSVTRINNGGKVSLKERGEIVDEVIGESVAKFRRRFPSQQVAVRAPDEVLLVPMDVMLIEQVLINLLENAVRHSGVEKTIDLSAEKTGDRVVFRVRDYGKGVSEKELPRLFSGNLGQDDSTRGMGIGLSVCKSIIEAHGGELSAENKKSGGAEFSFWLPLEAADAAEKG
jgi:two-component system sensor histidine kinase KdpD